MFCTKCGKHVEITDKYCASCGMQIQKNNWSHVNRIENTDSRKQNNILNFEETPEIKHLRWSQAPIHIKLLNLFNGRLARFEFLSGGLLLGLIIGMIAVAVSDFPNLIPNFLLSGWWKFVATFAIFFVTFFFNASITIRRVHDFNWPGWTMFIFPFLFSPYNPFSLLIPGKNRANKYGEPMSDKGRTVWRTIFNTYIPVTYSKKHFILNIVTVAVVLTLSILCAYGVTFAEIK